MNKFWCQLAPNWLKEMTRFFNSPNNVITCIISPILQNYSFESCEMCTMVSNLNFTELHDYGILMSLTESGMLIH